MRLLQNMQTDLSNSISNEIDAIIARAMAEYAAAKGVDVFTTNNSVEEQPQEPVEPQHEEIPVNSGSILVSENTSRFSSASWYNNVKSKNVILAGVGGIGSYVAFLLARMQVLSLTVFDNDVVEAANMSGQLYSDQHIGMQKVMAIADTLLHYAEFPRVMVMNELYTANSDASDIMICGFDNMEARKIFYNNWRRYVEAQPEEERKHCLFIDGRLAAESLQVFCLTGDDEYNNNRYRKEFLFEDYEADPTVCSYKQTTFMANMIGSLIVNLFVNFCANECDPLVPRDLPFFTEYTAETMYFKVVS